MYKRMGPEEEEEEEEEGRGERDRGRTLLGSLLQSIIY
jgi:hypothetical protein